MPAHDVLVIGAGVSGACFAFHAARAGRRVVVLERESRPGGCLHSERTPSGFWFELGAHTCYSTYAAFVEVLEGCGLKGELLARGEPVLRMLDGERVLPGANLRLLMSRLDKWELLRSLSGWLSADREVETVRDYYSRLVGQRNYRRVLAPLFAAVPSQCADDFPASMLFKRRPRLRSVPRSFTLKGGLQTAVEAALRQPGIEQRLGCDVERLERVGERWMARLRDGERIEAGLVALATPSSATGRLLEQAEPEIAAEAAKVKEAEIDSLGFVISAAKARVPLATFLIPLRDRFHSVVTRDVIPDPERRAFTLHFGPGGSGEQRLRRACQVLGVEPQDIESLAERHSVLPSPELGHDEIVRTIDRLLAGRPLAITGNWFGGLSIEDCAQRSRAEWRRVSAST